MVVAWPELTSPSHRMSSVLLIWQKSPQWLQDPYLSADIGPRAPETRGISSVRCSNQEPGSVLRVCSKEDEALFQGVGRMV
jgi:hypothetical protein